jgi:hypothetical protein
MFCQIEDKTLTGCADSTSYLFLLLLYQAQMDDKLKKCLNQQCPAILTFC